MGALNRYIIEDNGYEIAKESLEFNEDFEYLSYEVKSGKILHIEDY